MRPATRVDNWVLFVGGHSRKLTLLERLSLWLGLKETVRR